MDRFSLFLELEDVPSLRTPFRTVDFVTRSIKCVLLLLSMQANRGHLSILCGSQVPRSSQPVWVPNVVDAVTGQSARKKLIRFMKCGNLVEEMKRFPICRFRIA